MASRQQEWKPAQPQQAYSSTTNGRYPQQHQQQKQQGYQGQGYQSQSYDRRDDRRDDRHHQTQYQHQQQQQEYYPTHSSNMTQMQANNNAKQAAYSWVTLGLAKAIVGILTLVALLTLGMSVHGLFKIQEARKLLTISSKLFPSTTASSSTSWSSRSSSSRSGSPSADASIDLAKSVNAQLDAAFAQAIIYAYILIALSALQILMSIVGFVGAAKKSINMYKAYVYATVMFLVAWVVMLALMRGGWVLILSVLVHVAVAYPMWAVVKRWEVLGDEY